MASADVFDPAALRIGLAAVERFAVAFALAKNHLAATGRFGDRPHERPIFQGFGGACPRRVLDFRTYILLPDCLKVNRLHCRLYAANPPRISTSNLTTISMLLYQ